jgi:hypothetical protein
VLLATLVGALLLATLMYEEDDPTSRLGGDYPAFYAAGAIAGDGDWDQLYQAERQQREQAGLIDDEGGYLYFSYPPFVAALYAPLAGLDYRWSFLVHTALMGMALYGALLLMAPWLDRLGWPQPALLVAALAFYPVLRAVPGGQNTTLSLLLLAAATRLDWEGKAFWAGVVSAALAFKPQFGIVLLLLLLVARRWRMIAGWMSGALVLYVASAVVTGGEWIADWWEQAQVFSEQNVAANGANFISLPGFFENLLGSGSTVAGVLGYGSAAAVAAGVAYYWWRHPATDHIARFALAAAAGVVVAPQTLFYDAGLLLGGALVVLALPARTARLVLIVALIASWTQVAAASLGWSPLGPLSWLATAALLWWAYRAGGPVITAELPTPV